MTRRDVNEGDVFRKGFATNALESGASTGQVPAVASDGQMEFVAAGGGAQVVTRETIIVPSADILQLTSGVDITSAPASGKMIVPVQMMFALLYGTTPYTHSDNQNLYVSTIKEYLIESNGGSWGYMARGNMLRLVGLSVSSLFIPSDDVSLAGVDGQALAILMNENPAGGDSDLSVTTWYALEDVPS